MVEYYEIIYCAYIVVINYAYDVVELVFYETDQYMVIRRNYKNAFLWRRSQTTFPYATVEPVPVLPLIDCIV